MCVNVTLYNDPSALVSHLAKQYLYPILDLLEGNCNNNNNNWIGKPSEPFSESDIPKTKRKEEKEEEFIHVSRKPGLRIKVSTKKPIGLRKSGRVKKSRVMNFLSSDEYEQDEEFEDLDDVCDDSP